MFRSALRWLVLVIGTPLLVAACAGTPAWAPDEEVARARYVHDGPAELVLYTMISNRTGQGGHTGLMINGGQRVLFDPAGSWRHSRAPERNDVFYGFTPTMERFYVAYHARETWHLVVQRIEVSPQIADMAIRLAEAAGPVPNGYCAQATSRLLRQLPGFEGLPQTFHPVRLSTAFGALPGVSTETIFSDLPDSAVPERLAAQELRAQALLHQ